LLRTRQRLQGLLSEVEADIAEAMRPVDDIDAQIAEGTGDNAALIAQRQSELERLRPTLEPLQAQASQLRSTLGDLNWGVELSSGGGAEVLSPAWVPDTPVNPNVPLN